jgi:hypothetical protein
MGEKRVIVTIKDSGEIHVDQEGFHGSTCAKEAEMLLQAIGGSVVERKNKPEFYEDGDNPVSVLQQ